MPSAVEEFIPQSWMLPELVVEYKESLRILYISHTFKSVKRSLVPLVTAGVLMLAGCAGADDSANSAATSLESSSPSASPTPTETFDPVSLPALMQTKIVGSDLVVGDAIGSTANYTRHPITYKANEFTISGIMNIPKGEGPFPTLVLGHGYIDTDIYTSGRGLKREQDYLANKGYIVLHTDYRNHAGSDDDPNIDSTLRLGYTIDVIAAARALRASGLPQVDTEKIGYLGRSMGGGIGYNVATVAPNEYDAIVLYAPVSANYVDNFNKWGRNMPAVGNPIIERFGSPEDTPKFWAGISAENYFDKIDDPIMIHHGTNDESCKVTWSERAAAQMEALNKDVTLHIYEGEQHAFGPQWELSMLRSVEFFQKNL
jgi:dipeptidyl aminopeptidase/acylaminoacyl peptidase